MSSVENGFEIGFIQQGVGLLLSLLVFSVLNLTKEK
jgi:hypothetical protein